MMSSLEKLSQIEAGLQDLIRAGCYSEAREQLAAYVSLAEKLAGELPGPDIEELASRTRKVLDWAFCTVRCRRAHLSMQHDNATRVAAYGKRTCGPASRLSLSA